ncbi:MAG: DUF4982 domain-containing protein [Lachnospiraceae bacterium]|nr:DUF4982 domain-containing protein [Lachnospiraceae bacterium]
MQCIKFNNGWLFEKVEGDSRLKAFSGERDTVSVTLPYDAMIREKRDKDCPAGAQSGFYPGGKYIYEKTFTTPPEWQGQDAILEFEGVYGLTRVWINGFLALTHKNGYVGFCVDLNSYLKYGNENLIRVEVDNRSQPNSRWYTGSGIYRDVNIYLGNQVYIPKDRLQITTLSLNGNVAVVEVAAPIKNSLGYGLEASCKIEVLYQNKIISSNIQKVILDADGTETLRLQIPVINPHKWSVETPELYTCRIQTITDNKVRDVEMVNFGIRTLSLDSVNGMQINGETVKLRGACIHHDNGVIGAETFSDAEMYRCKRLKEAGFNAIRSAHHPMSKAMLEACDKIGMLVMDELSDVWTQHKNPYDDADIFIDEADIWIKKMVEKDYNHPSVVLYCVGNEISEAGTEYGSKINRFLCNRFHELDNTRYTTNALNGLNCAGKRLRVIMRDVIQKFGMDTSAQGSGGGSNVLNSFMSLMAGERGKFFAGHPLVTEALEECSQSCDITGLNYLSGRYLLEKELHPGKTVLGTETYPADIEQLWKLVEENSHVIGDFTWAGYDYIGEAGVGIFHYDGNTNFTSVYPERLAYIGDIDLIGNRRPISYYREIVYGLREEPYIAVENMAHIGEAPTKTAWMFKDNISSWTWTGYEGMTAAVDVYSKSDEVELFLNGKSLGKQPAGKENHFTATYFVPYEAGVLKAIAYDKEKKVGEYQLISAGETTALCAELVNEAASELAYVKVWLKDANGLHNPLEEKTIRMEVTGNGKVEGFGSANPSGEEDYFTCEATTYEGCAMAAIRRNLGDASGDIRVKFFAEGSKSAEILIKQDGRKS